MKVIIDVFGGDYAPYEILKGCLIAQQKIKNLNLSLVGDQDIISPILKEFKFDFSRIETIDAKEVISNNDVPTVAIKTKKDSSLVKSLELLKSDDSFAGLVSAGATGSVLTGSVLKVGRIKGVLRPALAPTLPTKKGTNVLLIDCGANMDCKPEQLCQFALMGSAYAKNVFKVENPRVALLNVGVEDKKGNELTKQVFPMLKEMNINFVGNMEARDALSGDYDVIVADAFSGNVLLKSLEGGVLTLLKMLKKELCSSLTTKIGALLCKPAFNKIKSVMDYSNLGGAPFLGVSKNIIKAHGSSKAKSIYECIKQIVSMHETCLTQTIKNEIDNYNLVNKND